MARFDAYTCTAVGVSPEAMVGLIFGLSDTVQSSRGFHQFAERVAVKDVGGHEVGMVQWGGAHRDRVMVEVKGERTPAFVDRLRRDVGEHRCTRVDSCEDFDAVGVFDSLLSEVMDVKARFGLYGPRDGDWDFPELGRTQYLGSSKSAVRARLYEKGKQAEYKHLDLPNWCRVEVQVRPQKDAKTEFSRLSALEVWGASPFTRDLAGRVLKAEVSRVAAGSVYRLSNRDRALTWLCKQYGPHLISLKNDLGSWECVGLTLADMLRSKAVRGDFKGGV